MPEIIASISQWLMLRSSCLALRMIFLPSSVAESLASVGVNIPAHRTRTRSPSTLAFTSIGPRPCCSRWNRTTALATSASMVPLVVRVTLCVQKYRKPAPASERAMKVVCVLKRMLAYKTHRASAAPCLCQPEILNLAECIRFLEKSQAFVRIYRKLLSRAKYAGGGKKGDSIHDGSGRGLFFHYQVSVFGKLYAPVFTKDTVFQIVVHLPPIGYISL